MIHSWKRHESRPGWCYYSRELYQNTAALPGGEEERNMLEDHIIRISDKIHLNFYKRLFSIIKEREGSLTAMEVFAVEVIHALGTPTISEFADFLGISRPGASYKVASLIQKGYIVKEASTDDKREFRLTLTDKYYNYIGLYEDGLREYVAKLEENFSKRQLEAFESVLSRVEEEIDAFPNN
jgi:DNA-binding MarR family transcriptional regulator